ncbi:MAG TPA: hypothetical protein VH281_04175 [Gaiellaceae bacterium]|jgi:hypothetical protein
MVALIVIGLLLTRVAGRGQQKISDDRAVEIARPYVHFTPEGHNIRFLRRGIPPRAFWAVSFWIKDSQGDPTRVTLVLIDAETGRVDSVKSTT